MDEKYFWMCLDAVPLKTLYNRKLKFYKNIAQHFLKTSLRLILWMR